MNIVAENIQLGSGKLTVMVKDSIDIQGVKTISGSRALEDTAPAARNAEVIEHILNADCMITAKTNLHELAFGITGINHAYGTPVNPKYLELIPGGSSSGSAAAVAANLADFTLGTDTGGSIANSVEMIETAMQIIDPTFTAQDSTAAPKLAWLKVQAEARVTECIENYLKQANLQVEPVEAASFEKAFHAGMQIINYENWQAYGELTKTGLIGADVQGRLLKAAETTLEQVQQAEQVKAEFTQEIDALLEQYDALLLPTLPQIPPKVADAENTVAFLNLTGLVRPFNLSGHPAISIPLETEQGLPVGLQIVTKRNADEQLCAIAKFVVKAAQ